MFTLSPLHGRKVEEIDSWVSQDATLISLLLPAITGIISMHARCNLSWHEAFPIQPRLETLGPLLRAYRCVLLVGYVNIYYTTALGFCRLRSTLSHQPSLQLLNAKPGFPSSYESQRLGRVLSLASCDSPTARVSASVLHSPWASLGWGYKYSCTCPLTWPQQTRAGKEKLTSNQTANCSTNDQGTNVTKWLVFGQATSPPTKYPSSGSTTKRSLQMPSQRFTDRITCWLGGPHLWPWTQHRENPRSWSRNSWTKT